ncbi:oxidoreductase FixC [Actinomycetota bacterium]|nr:oxidoreductase FixC [Actinomycetota bacterium]
MSDFDVIVVGAGCAGSVAAYELAKVGKSVLVVERGNYAGAKNMTGGRIYTHSLAQVFADFADDAPLERRITHERISMMTPDANFTVDYSSQKMLQAGQDSYSVLRGPFDQWLAVKAEDAGAEYIYGIAVEDLLKEGERVTGISAGEDEITADVVILADGVNSLLSQKAVGYARPKPSTLAVGVKQVIELGEQTITDRVLAGSASEGAAWLFAGDATHGHIGGGFMYTNRSSISLGVISTISDLATAKTPIYQMLEDLKQHSAVAPLIAGGKVVEHSGHMVPEGGFEMMPPLAGDGVLLAGDSAMMCINLGYMVRGMDYAVAAGMHAGRSVAAALDAGDVHSGGLSRYKQALQESFVLQDLQQFKDFPHFMETTPAMFSTYPKMIQDVMDTMFVVDGTPVKPLRKSVMPIIKGVGFGQLFKDARKGIKAL